MNSQDLIEKYKFYKIQNNMIRKSKNQNKYIFPKTKINIPIKANKCEYFPIETDKSKADGQIIYLVTEESGNNNDFIQKNDEQDKPLKIFNKDILVDNNFIIQKNIEIQGNNKSKYKIYY